MDVDPLADSVPPRHAIESDEEDEYNPLSPSSQQEKPQPVDVKIVGKIPSDRALIIAAGDAGKYWARGANLGEQSGAVTVNNIQVGLAFLPQWTKATVVVSEVLTRLPLWAMHTYAQAIIDGLKPSSVALLDTYPVPSYIGQESTPYTDGSLRYLSTTDIDPAFNSKAQPFSPPNLVHTTSASFIAILATKQSKGTLVLLPSPHIPPPAPKTLEHSDFSHVSEDPVEWSTEATNNAQDLLFLAVGEHTESPWKHPGGQDKPAAQRKGARDIGDGGMYI